MHPLFEFLMSMYGGGGFGGQQQASRDYYPFWRPQPWQAASTFIGFAPQGVGRGDERGGSEPPAHVAFTPPGMQGSVPQMPPQVPNFRENRQGRPGFGYMAAGIPGIQYTPPGGVPGAQTRPPVNSGNKSTMPRRDAQAAVPTVMGSNNSSRAGRG